MTGLDTHRLGDFAMRNRLPHRFVDLENDPTAETLLCQLGVGPEDTPVAVWRDRAVSGEDIDSGEMRTLEARKLFVFIRSR